MNLLDLKAEAENFQQVTNYDIILSYVYGQLFWYIFRPWTQKRFFGKTLAMFAYKDQPNTMSHDKPRETDSQHNGSLFEL